MRRSIMIIGFLMVVGCAELRQDLAQLISRPAPKPVEIGGKAVVTASAEKLGESELSGVVFLVDMGGTEYGAVCVGDLERLCGSLRSSDAVKISAALLKYGSLSSETINYQGHYLEVRSIQVR